MRILFVNTLYYPQEVGGAERSVRTMAEHLAVGKHDVSVMSTHQADSMIVKEVAGVRVFYVPSRNIFYPHGRNNLPSWTQHTPVKLLWHSVNTYNLLMRPAVRHILKVANPEVVHTNNLTGFSTAVWSEVQRQGRALVHTIRDYYLLCRRSTMYQNGSNCTSLCWQCKPFSSVRMHISRSVDAVVGISQFILDEHQKHGGFCDTPIRAIIPNPYDGPMQNPNDYHRRPDGSKLQVGFLGRLSRKKGLDVLLKVAKRLSEKIQVHVGGTGDSSYVESLRRSYPIENVTYHGYVDPSSFLPSLDVLVVPSQWHEPLGRVVFEAYAYGVPVIGATRGGIPELIEEGRTGYVFDPSEPRLLSDLLCKLVSSPSLLQAMRSAAFDRASRYRAEVVVDKYLDVYNQAIRLAA